MATGNTTTQHDDGDRRHNNGKGQHGDMRHNDGDRHQHGGGKGQQGNRWYDKGDGQHNETARRRRRATSYYD